MLIVGIAGDPRPHRAPLARIAGSRVAVERRPPWRPRPEDELRATENRIDADGPDLMAAAGLWVVSAWANPSRGVVEVHITGPDERAAAEYFAARYGDAVTVVWVAPSRFLEVWRPFGSWTSDGRRIRVFYALDPNGEEPGDAWVAEENDERIVIALTGLQPVRIVQTLLPGFHPRHADAELREPVGDRAVIDASAGVARPSLAQLGLPAGPPSRPRGAPETDAPRPIHRRSGQVWFAATDDDAVYEAMLPTDPPRDEDGEPEVMPAVRRDMLDAIRRDIANSRFALDKGLTLTWVTTW
jgi:hypothetical protein